MDISKKETKRIRTKKSKKITVTGMSVTLNGKVYGTTAMETTYETSLSLPCKERVQEICAEAYIKLLRLFTENTEDIPVREEAKIIDLVNRESKITGENHLDTEA